MMDIKWIKIVTDIFDDEKMLLIEALPEADGIIVIWFKLLCLAGKQNNSGVFLLNNKIPYTDKMLSTIFRRKESIVTLALNTFEQLGMIEIINNTITIPNWSKHQSLDKIERNNEYMRQYMKKYREKQKLLTEGKEECKINSKINSKINVNTPDKIREDKIREDKIKEDKIHFAEFVAMTNVEHDKLVNTYGKEFTDQCIEILDNYKGANGKKYKSDYRAILNWVVDKVKEKQPKSKGNHIDFRDLV